MKRARLSVRPPFASNASGSFSASAATPLRGAATSCVPARGTSTSAQHTSTTGGTRSRRARMVAADAAHPPYSDYQYGAPKRKSPRSAVVERLDLVLVLL